MIYKAVKVSMIRLPGEPTLLDEFKAAKDAGFDGMSLFGPEKYDVNEAMAARDKTDLPVHNVNIFGQWQTRLSDPDPAMREKALQTTIGTLKFASDLGASTILQVVGKATDPINENAGHVAERSREQLKKALPTAAKLGVRIACENVANGHGESIAAWKDYLDSFGSPWVCAFFDIGNHDRFDGGAPAWIRGLGHRIVKIDVKDHDHTIAKNVNLFDGNVDWPDVRAALAEIRYDGWATAEVKGGDLARLTEVAERMDKALGIA